MTEWVIWQGANVATMNAQHDYGLIEDGALVVKNDKFVWVGKSVDLPKEYVKSAHVHDVKGYCITPGLIDCHTHLVYGHHRAHEYEQRLRGMSYESIIKAGGGIQSTVDATRKMDKDKLFNESMKRLQSLLKEGVTTIEIKSGYGLDYENERKILLIAKALAKKFPVDIQTTFLGAHVLPNEFESASGYIGYLIDTVLPKLNDENLIDAVDGFCDRLGFSVEDLELLLKWARENHLKIKLHAEQFSNMQGAELAAKYKAISADHLEYLDEAGVRALKASGTVAVLLPGAFYFLQQTQKPPISLLRQYQIPMAIATDSNPGTSPNVSLLLMLNMACVLFHLTPLEALQGVTSHAALALGMDDRGKIANGLSADFVLWDIQDPRELAYRFGENRCYQVIKNGRTVYEQVNAF